MARNKVRCLESPTTPFPNELDLHVHMQEVAVVLLDVGPLMNPIREFAGKAICGFLQSKVHITCAEKKDQFLQKCNWSFVALPADVEQAHP